MEWEEGIKSVGELYGLIVIVASSGLIVIGPRATMPTNI
jgi:hypothetical protein